MLGSTGKETMAHEGGDADAGDSVWPGGPGPGLPRWVKVGAIVAVVVVLLLVGLLVAFGGTEGHGPGRHTPRIGDPGAGDASGPPATAGPDRPQSHR